MLLLLYASWWLMQRSSRHLSDAANSRIMSKQSSRRRVALVTTNRNVRPSVQCPSIVARCGWRSPGVAAVRVHARRRWQLVKTSANETQKICTDGSDIWCPVEWKVGNSVRPTWDWMCFKCFSVLFFSVRLLFLPLFCMCVWHVSIKLLTYLLTLLTYFNVVDNVTTPMTSQRKSSRIKCLKQSKLQQNYIILIIIGLYCLRSFSFIFCFVCFCVRQTKSIGFWVYHAMFITVASHSWHSRLPQAIKVVFGLVRQAITNDYWQ